MSSTTQDAISKLDAWRARGNGVRGYVIDGMPDGSAWVRLWECPVATRIEHASAAGDTLNDAVQEVLRRVQP
jgi:hypothetical protein